MKLFLLLIFVASSSAIRLTCDFRNDFFWPIHGNAYTCSVTGIDFSDHPTTVTGYNGNHLPGFSAANVEFLFFSSAFCPSFNLTIVPKGISRIFPNNLVFFFSSCDIHHLNGDELNEYPRLERFGLYTSNLVRAPGNLFSGTPNMRLISFFETQLQNVGDGLLSNLSRLEQAHFVRNPCIDQRALSPAEVPALEDSLRKNCPDV